jgi:F-type H+-transporting ATPase subunit delta
MSLYDKAILTYTKALFFTFSQKSQIRQETQKEEKTPLSLFQMAEELFRLKYLFVFSKNVRNYFQDPTLAEEKKYALLVTFFPDLSFQTKAFLRLLVEKKHLFLLPQIADTFFDRLEKLLKFTKVKLYLASPLQKRLGNIVLKALKKQSNSSQIYFTVIYDPKLLGGFVLEYNNYVIDASLVKEFRTFLS